MVLKRWWLAAFIMGVVATEPADAAWRRAVTDHFVIYSEDSPDDLQAYAEKLERFDSAVRVARGMGESAITPAAKLKVFAVRDVDLLQKIFGVRGSVAGFEAVSVRTGRVVPIDVPGLLVTNRTGVLGVG